MNSKLYKCHYIFILNRPIKIISLIIFIGLLLIYVLLLNSFPKELSYKQLIESFYQVSYDIMRIFIITVSIIISGYSFFSDNDQYRCLILSKIISRKKYFITKYLVLLIYLLIFSFIETVTIAMIGYYKFFMIEYSILNYFVDLGIGIIYYVGISILIIQIFDYFYCIFISLGIFITSSIIDTKIIFYFIPIYFDNRLYHNYFYRYYCLFLCVLLLIINIIVYERKDLY